MKLLNSFDKHTEPAHNILFVDKFEFFECPVCKEFHLYYTPWSSEEVYYEDHNFYDDGQVLYPYTEQVNISSLPKNIKNAYESALKVRKIDYVICLMALRRTLEMICKDKGAVGGTLHQKLNELQAKKILPPLMGDISQVIKDAGNAAAHGDDIVFNSHMVEHLFKFTNKIIEYVYILPNEMRRTKFQMEMLTGKKTSEKRTNHRKTPRKVHRKNQRKSYRKH
ncbi:DUF4145 domain-containing protein [Bacillus subtilis]|nr:DUF4145 domain-containing protein [Bacillus subtilis]